MQTMESHPVVAPPRRTDYMTIAQLVVSGLGFAIALLTAGVLALAGAINLFGEVGQPTSTNLMFGMAWISLLIAILAVPSILFSIQRLSGREVFPWLARYPRNSFRLATLLLLVWPLVLLLGNLLSSGSSLAWLLLPPLQLLAAGIPTWWLIEIARRNLRSGSRQRGWGLVNFSMFISTPALMVIELIAMGVLLVLFIMWASTQPELIRELERLAERLVTVQADPEAVLQMLSPYLLNPWVIFSAFAITAGLVPLIEEFLKPLAIWLLAGRRLTPSEGFVAGVLCGGAFGLVESLFYLTNPTGDGWAVLAAGRAGTILLHISTTALVGWAMAKTWQTGAYLRLAAAYLAAVALHGLWNGMAIFSALPSLVQNPAEDMRLIYNLSKAAPFGIALLAVLLFALLIGINRYLRNQSKGTAFAVEPANGPLEPIP